jgi:signal transduction histidine kinase
MKFFIFLNAIIWAIFGCFIIYGHYFQLNVHIALLFGALIGFSSAVVTTLYWNTFLLNVSYFMYMTPIVFFIIGQMYFYQNFSPVILIFIVVINFLYTNRQAAVALEESYDRISSHEKLKKTLVEVEQTHRALEKETFNTLQASRMSALVEFAAGVAHEINNPLTIIKLSTERIRKEIKDDIAIDDKLIKIDFSIERIEKVINSLRNVTENISYDDFTDHRFDLIFDSVMELYYEKARLSGIRFEIPKIPRVHVLCISSQVAQIMINVLNNAIEALGQLEGTKKIIFKFIEEDRYFKFFIINTGPKIPNELKDKIFLPFFTTKLVGSGPGLGLTLARSLANGNGGSIEYIEDDGAPSFLITLKKSTE